jgi:L-seryl-tRNA(Ser) seleniumtransferase
LPGVLDQIRQAYIDSKASLPDEQEIITRVRSQLEAWLKPSLVPVINAAGVVLHTNLGRAPLSQVTRNRDQRGCRRLYQPGVQS